MGGVIGWAAYLVYVAGGHKLAAEKLESWAVHKMADSGFAVETILVEGRVNASRDDLFAALDAERGMPIFAFDPKAAHETISQIPWIKEAKITRQLPDTIHIELTERVPVALWQHQGKLSLIDDEGFVLADRDLKPFKDYLMVAGDGAEQAAADLKTLLKAESWIVPRLESALRISRQRWDLMLKDGKRIHLPADQPELALRRLFKAQESDQLLDMHLKSVDLLHEDKIIVETAPGVTQDVQTSYSNASFTRKDI